jgi:ATP-dependent DNA helicase RecG
VKDVVETLLAMANADGGELVVGIEDDGTLTGIPHPADKLKLLTGAPRDRNYVEPLLPVRSSVVQDGAGRTYLHYEVEWSPAVHRSSDGRYLLRVRDHNVPFAAEQIAALKQTKAQGLIERSTPPNATVDDLDIALLESLLPRMKFDGSAQAFLIDRHLAEERRGEIIPSLSALLLFGRDPSKWHPRCHIDFVRWEGIERKFGAELNVVKRVPVRQPLAILIEMAHGAIQPFIRERQPLQDLLFTEHLEYPTFVWQEAIVNAVAHRDYSISGAPIEVWMFDDRIEVRSPGLPPSPASVEALNRRERVHISRNPVMVRVLVDLGYVRELGEGIPRMFTEMEREGFYPPQFDSVADTYFQVTLRNQPVYDRATMEWLRGFEAATLTGDQKRVLAFARAHGNHFTSRDYQKLVGLDIYGASNSIRDLASKGIVRAMHKGSRVYELVEPGAEIHASPPEDLLAVWDVVGDDHPITNEIVQDALNVSRPTATRYLRTWVSLGWLEPVGEKSQRRYERKV